MATLQIKVHDKSGLQVADMIAELNKRLHRPDYESLFPLFRVKVEQMLKEGFSMQKITKEDRE